MWVKEDWLKSLHPLGVDHGRLAGVPRSIAEIEVRRLELAESEQPYPGHATPVLHTALKTTIRRTENVVAGEVPAWFRKVSFGLIVLQGDLDLDVERGIGRVK